ncbi:DUF4376 domain-containing protein [Halomonas sp. GD1P12]|uniref:DUF4376 domain-containing protein n=1 Tax=Halomonas sp. GD1P12 TaxID=2982691 RepID=UPI0021E4109C|nr:DUF4376 domain-containing protein [Halomonas sp. GD1P12]UYF99337.1 DUF4376 domain-containing protein [Halomonas sp. GD1P12]
MHARFDTDNRLAELINVDPTGRYHPNVIWIPVNDEMIEYLTDDYIVDRGKVQPPTLDYLRDQLKARLAEHRHTVETGGMELPNGSRVHTDRESQAQLTGAYQTLVTPFVESIDWKGPDGWITVTETELRPIAQAVALHVQGCFKAERRVSEQITAAEDAEALYAIDIAQAFGEALASTVS